MKEQVYLLLMITPDFTIKRIFKDPAKAMRTAGKIRLEFNQVKWFPINKGHRSESGSIYLTIEPLELE